MEGERFGTICTLDRGKEADGARMHNAFFGPAKKANYLFELKLDFIFVDVRVFFSFLARKI